MVTHASLGVFGILDGLSKVEGGSCIQYSVSSLLDTRFV